MTIAHCRGQGGYRRVRQGAMRAAIRRSALFVGLGEVPSAWWQMTFHDRAAPPGKVRVGTLFRQPDADGLTGEAAACPAGLGA